MLRFSIVEVINKLIGLIITALLARILDNQLGTFIYYQTIYTYLYSTAVFSSDYKFLIYYKKDDAYIGSADFYKTMVFRIALLILILTIAPFFLINLNDFAFWPFYLSIAASLIVSEFVLFVNEEKKGLITYRFLSQVIALGLTALFYFKLINVYYAALIIMVQNLALLVLTFWFSKKYFIKNISLKPFLNFFNIHSLSVVFELIGFYVIRHFFLFFTTIELYVFSYYKYDSYRDIFAEGLRLSIVLIPFTYFYINFNINKLDKKFYNVIFIIASLFVILSPLTTLIFFGENFTKYIFYFNFFISVFYFNAFVEKESLDVLTLTDKKRKLIKLNLSCFGTSILILFFAIRYLSLEQAIYFFILKLYIYVLLFNVIFNSKTSFTKHFIPFLFIIGLNLTLHHFNYYNWAVKHIVDLKFYIGFLL